MPIYQRNKVWYVAYSFQGKRHRKRVGHSKKVAELKLKDIELKIERRESLGILESKLILFPAFAAEYLAYAKTNKAIKTYALNVGNIKALSPYFKDTLLSEITPQMIERFKSERKQSVKPATVNRDLACLKNMFNKAITWGYLDSNPMKGVPLLPEPPGRLRYLAAEEYDRLLRALPLDTAKLVRFALNTGMRKSEILGLRWKDVNMGQRLIAVEITKTNERRILPMNDEVYQLLVDLEKGRLKSDLVFTDGAVNLRRYFERAVQRAGIEHFVFHDLRHTFASYLVMSGASLKVVQQLLGHKDIKMTLRYSHLSQEHLHEAVGRLNFKKIDTDLTQEIIPFRKASGKSL